MQVWLVVLGAVLALTTSIVMEVVRTRIAQSRVRRLLADLLHAEIPMIVEITESMLDETGKGGFIPLLRINELDNARQGFDRNRDWLITFEDNDLRRDTFEFYRLLLTTCTQIRIIEGELTKSNLPAQASRYWNGQRQVAITSLQTIANRGRDLRRQLRMNK